MDCGSPRKHFSKMPQMGRGTINIFSKSNKWALSQENTILMIINIMGADQPIGK